jgi:hypothetical protein
LANFNGGVYKVWNITGHVIIQVTHTGGLSSVVSALFFGPGATVGPPPTVSITTPTAGASLTGSVSLSATTTSTPGIASVQFQEDGNNIGAAVTGAGPTFSTTWATTTVANGSHTLTAIATDSLGQSTTSTGVAITTSNTGPPPAGATFLRSDAVTRGNWKGVYGGDGFAIPNDSTLQPTYGTVTTTAATYTWNPTTTDPRALLKTTSTTDRAASAWYTTATTGTGATFSFDVNLTDGQIHQIALYCLDLDTSGRAETISVLDANTQAALNTQQVSNFSGGIYYAWSITGHVIVKVTYTGGPNAVVSGLFFGGGAPLPVVAITAPAPGTVSGTTTATATATSSVGIASVQFQLDGTNIGSAVTTSPYTIQWNTVTTATNGSHTLTAVAMDRLGQTTTSAGVALTVANSGPPPTASITAPSAGATVTGTSTITANATSSLAVQAVQFQVDGTNFGSPVTGSGPAYSIPWNTAALGNGPHTVSAIASDYLGQSTSSALVTVNVENGPAPSISISVPAPGASVQGASVTLTALATSTLGSVSVQFQIDGVNLGSAVTGSSPFSTTWDSTKGGNGSHTISATATDVLGQTKSASIMVNVTNPAPVITITNPTASAPAFAIETLTAHATSGPGIASVQFVIDGTNFGSPVTTGTASNFSTTWDTTTVVNGQHTVAAIATDVLGQSTTSATVSFTVTNAAASFVKLDTTTSGNWVGTYGQEGFVIADDANNSQPAYASVLNNGATYDWALTTSDGHALLKNTTGGDRIASTYTGTATTVSVNLTFNDLKTHRVAVYFVDFDDSGRNQTVSILDANSNAVLDTRTISAFHGGVYGVWNLKGQILIQATSNVGATSVLSGLFFQTAPDVSITAPAAGAVTGAVAVTATATSTTGVASVQFQVDGVNLGSAVAAPGPYTASWDSTKATNGPHVLTAIATDTTGLAGTSAGVTVTVSNTGATLPGATFVNFDTTTSGNWIGVYGQDAKDIPEDPNSTVPSYAAINVTGGTLYAWTDTPSDISDPRGLQAIPPGMGIAGPTTPAAGRDPSAWYSNTSFTVDVNVTDGQAHQLALYLVDFDSSNRTETISILNANTNAVLDTRAITNFHNGVYAIWNITGHVIIQATYTGATGFAYSNAVISGLFFRSYTGLTPPVVSITNPAAGTVTGGVTVTANATSSVGLASVRFQLDGVDLGSPATAPGPYSTNWLSTTASNSSHTLTAIAADTNGQTTISSPVVVTVSNGAPPAAAATFLTTDTTTSGTWVGKYGVDGYIIPSDVSNPAFYSTVSLNGSPGGVIPYIYANPAPAGHNEALQLSPTSPDTRIASADYVPTSYGSNNGVITIDLNLVDYGTHQIELYFLDWMASVRTENVAILDASTLAVLSTQQVTGYTLGKYLVYNLTGHVLIKITEVIPDPQHDPSSVSLNGLFFK